MVLSQLPLAICFPSGLYATERTLTWREGITLINRTREEKMKKLTNASARSPGTRTRTWWNHIRFYVFRAFISQKKSHFKWPVSQTLRQKHDCVVNFLSYWLKKLTLPSARSASTGNLQIASPTSWWLRQRYRWQFAFHRGSTPQNRHFFFRILWEVSRWINRRS